MKRSSRAFTPLEKTHADPTQVVRVRKHSSLTGFTLAELLLAAAILAFTLSGILATYLNCSYLVSIARNMTAAVNAAQDVMEEIRSSSFSRIFTDYHQRNFTITEIPTARGVIYVDNSDPDLLLVRISVCWQQDNRIIGEDRNLNGSLDVGEDLNGNNRIDSIAQLVTLITPR